MDDYLGDSDGDRESEEELSEVEQANAIVVETVSDSSSEEDEGSQVMVRREATGVEKHFDKSLAATHSYMGRELIPLSGRTLLEAGWRGRLPVAAHTGAVFPGETVPMLLPDPDDATILSTTIQNDKLFGLLCPDATGALVSGYGVLCEVYEAGARRTAVTFKARARHRFRLLHMPRRPVPLHNYIRMQLAEVCVLPELRPAQPLLQARLASLDGLRASPPAAGGSGGAVLLGGLQPDAVGARPARAVQGGRRAAAPAHGAALHRRAELAVLHVVRRADSVARGRAAHVQRGRALQLHQLRRVHARHRDGVARGRRAAARPALRGVLLVPRVHLARAGVRRVPRAPRLAVRGAEPRPAPGGVLRPVPQQRAAARSPRRRPRVMPTPRQTMPHYATPRHTMPHRATHACKYSSHCMCTKDINRKMYN